MATLRNEQKLATLSKENHEEHPRSNQARDTNVPRSQELYITQVAEKIEGRVTKKLSKEFSRTESRILGALSWRDEFLLNPLIQGHYGSAPETSRNEFGINQGTTEDDSQSDSHPDGRVSQSRNTQNFVPYDASDSSEPDVQSPQSVEEETPSISDRINLEDDLSVVNQEI